MNKAIIFLLIIAICIAIAFIVDPKLTNLTGLIAAEDDNTLGTTTEVIAPDFYVRDGNYEEIGINEKGSVNLAVTAEVGNEGKGEEEAVFGVYNDGKLLGEKEFYLSPYSSETVRIDSIHLFPGSYDLELVISSESDSDKSNNIAKLDVYIPELADLLFSEVVKGKQVVISSSPNDYSVFHSKLKFDKTYYFIVNVENEGKAPSEPASLGVYYDKVDPDHEIDTAAIPQLEPGESAQVIAEIAFSLSNKYTIYGVIDPDDEVPEADENNNALKTTIEVVGSASGGGGGGGGGGGSSSPSPSPEPEPEPKPVLGPSIAPPGHGEGGLDNPDNPPPPPPVIPNPDPEP